MMHALHAIISLQVSQLWEPRILLLAKVSNHLSLRYYQYEVTFGLYMLTQTEKVVLNTILLSIFTGSLYALHIGLEPFMIHAICSMISYITSSLSGAEVSAHSEALS